MEVYADESDPLPGEMIDAIELPDRPQSSYELEVRLLASAHFRLSSALVQPLFIERMKSRTANVRFTITVVSAETLQKVEKKPASVCAEFFYEGRPVGKVMRNVELVGITPFPKPKSLEGLPKARMAIAIDPGTVAADLVVTVTSQLENDNRHFWCTVMTRLLPEYTRGITDEWITAEVTSAVVGNFMRDFTKAGLNKIERLAKLRGAGKDLYKASPDIFKEVFWKLIDSNASLKSIAIVSDEPFVPWELMIPYRKSEEGAPPDVRDPLGVEFLVGRMTRRSHVAGAQRVPLRDSYVVAPVFEGPRSLPHAQKEADFVTSLFPGARIDPANFESLNVKLDPCRSLLHFACHGEVTSQGQQILYLDDEKEFSAVDLNGLPGPERGIPIARPLVFLNACQVGRPVPGLVGVNGFAATFTEMGAQAVVAPLWSVKDTIAHEIALNFYTIAKKDKSVPFAEILRQQREIGRAHV